MIHAPLVLGLTQDILATVTPQAAYVAEQYKTRPSVYETNASRIMRGFAAEEALARHRGVPRSDYREPWKTPYDVWPDIEVRCVTRPSGKIDYWKDVALTLYARDREKIDRRWVLAMLDYDRMDIRYLGWQTGTTLLTGDVRATSRDGRPYTIIGMLWPDQLLPMESL